MDVSLSAKLTGFQYVDVSKCWLNVQEYTGENRNGGGDVVLDAPYPLFMIFVYFITLSSHFY